MIEKLIFSMALRENLKSDAITMVKGESRPELSRLHDTSR
jgi:hypothetical protein